MAIQAQLYSENHGFPMFGSHDLIMDNGCGVGLGGFNHFSFDLQQKQQLQQQHQQLQRLQQIQNQQQRNQQNLFLDNGSIIASTLKNNPNTTTTNNNNSHLPMLHSQSITSQFEKQRQEIDQYLRLQNERLRLVLQEQRKQQLAVVLKRIESKTLFLLGQKDEQIAQAANRTMELENFLRRLEAENQEWQKAAQENEAMVVYLNNALEQVKERTPFGFFNNDAEDAESCCDVNMEKDEELLQEVVQDETEENRGVLEVCELEKQRKLMMMTVCKGCNSRSSCMLFLPCRHLCSCEVCEPLLDCCPVCTKAKKASIQALIF
ncbi:probable BOI-related E3 ubiquitin-protein ligase 2 [Quercus robur]|uniref:probable BOI-related E3 ubiquitin-protein ligase 2 n=1 Tax=Quercus robur TaxID=38942 RepID=UPI0021628670|nr:probable BOI-related E3 ubiquitin-protein ligase 2 [Quercus robur]